MKEQFINKFVKSELREIAEKLKIDLPSKITLVKLKEKIMQFSYGEIINAIYDKES